MTTMNMSDTYKSDCEQYQREWRSMPFDRLVAYQVPARFDDLLVRTIAERLRTERFAGEMFSPTERHWDAVRHVAQARIRLAMRDVMTAADIAEKAHRRMIDIELDELLKPGDPGNDWHRTMGQLEAACSLASSHMKKAEDTLKRARHRIGRA